MKPDLDICPESRTIKRRFINGKIIRARIRSPFRSPRPAAPTTRKVRANASPPSDAKDASYLNEALGYRECLETCANMIKDISHKGFFKKLTTIVALEMVYSLDIKGTRKKCLQVAASSCMIAYKYCETQDAFPRLKLDDLVGWSSNCISRKEII